MWHYFLYSAVPISLFLRLSACIISSLKNIFHANTLKCCFLGLCNLLFVPIVKNLYRCVRQLATISFEYKQKKNR